MGLGDYVEAYLTEMNQKQEEAQKEQDGKHLAEERIT